MNELSENLEKEKKAILQNDTPKGKKIEKKIDKETKDIARSMVMSEYRQSLDCKPREDKRFSEILLKSQEKHSLNDINHVHSQSISSVPLTTRGNKSQLNDLRQIYDANGLISSNSTSYQALPTKNVSKFLKERVSSAS